LFFFLRRKISAIETGVPSNSSLSTADPGGRLLVAAAVEAISSSMLCALGCAGVGGEGALGLESCGSGAESSSREVQGRCR
jgi:hypothetical protein